MKYHESKGGEPYLLKKNGMYYGHNNCGYVNLAMMAEIYTEEYAKGYAKRIDEVQAVPFKEAISRHEEIDCYLERIIPARDFLKLNPPHKD